MNDAELRGLILKKFYDVRRAGYTQMPTDEIFDQATSFDICRQLAEHGLLNWKPLQSLDGFRGGMGQITADGVDVIEKTRSPPISIVVDQSISVANSPHAQVARDRGQNVSTKVRNIAVEIDKENVASEQKEEAKNLWNRVTENPLLSAVLDKVL
jgi:hypothetical protein